MVTIIPITQSISIEDVVTEPSGHVIERTIVISISGIVSDCS